MLLLHVFCAFTCNIRLHTISVNKMTKFVGLSWRYSIMYRSWLALAVRSEMSIRPWAIVFLAEYVTLLTLLKDRVSIVLVLLTSGPSSISKPVASMFTMFDGGRSRACTVQRKGSRSMCLLFTVVFENHVRVILSTTNVFSPTNESHWPREIIAVTEHTRDDIRTTGRRGWPQTIDDIVGCRRYAGAENISNA